MSRFLIHDFLIQLSVEIAIDVHVCVYIHMCVHVYGHKDI